MSTPEGASVSRPTAPPGRRRDDSVRVLILTTLGLDDYVYETLRAGASGFL